MNPILLQKQLKENAADLDEFYKDLKNWGEDMKRKEESQKNLGTNNQDYGDKKKRKSSPTSTKKCKSADKPQKPKTKLGCIDYSAWEKFDVDAELEKIDYNENEESDLTDEYDESLRDQAYIEKEKGNKHVKSEQWQEAIKCYTRAIDCYSYDPIFYANRALCFLKTKNMMKAELDCTMSLKLDKTYVKAYQRRAVAREAMNKLEEAEMDYLKVLELEPKNKETQAALEKLRKKISESVKVTQTSQQSQRPVSKFTASRQQKKNPCMISQQNNLNPSNKQNEVVHQQKKEMDVVVPHHWPSGSDDIILVKIVNKPVHMQSKKPLKRIEIMEATELYQYDKTENEKMNSNSSKTDNVYPQTLRTDDLKIVERKQPDRNMQAMLKETKNQANTNKIIEEQIELCVPKSSVQFYFQWKHLKTPENKYAYIKLIEPEKLPHIFKEFLESHVFSEILEVLAKCFINNGDKIFNYLLYFTKIRRFSTLTMFMTDNDKNYIRKLVDHLTKFENRSEEEVDHLVKMYEL